MAEKKVQESYLVVKAPFFYRNDQFFAAGQVVPANHPVVRRREHLFGPLTPIGVRPEPAVDVEPEPTPESAPEPEPEP